MQGFARWQRFSDSANWRIIGAMASLPTATLGNTGIEVTRLGFGAALFHPDKTHWTDQTAAALHHQVLDAGINFIDTAYDYVDSERRIGDFLAGRYGEFTLATKCGCTDTRPPTTAPTTYGRATTCCAAWRAASPACAATAST